MKLHVLGSGTMMPTKKRFPSSYMLDAGSTRLLLDCGHLTLARLLERGVLFRDIEGVCITHFHTDHFSHLLPMVHAMWVDNLFTHRQPTPLTVFGPSSLAERWKKLKEVFWPEQESYPVKFVEAGSAHALGSLTVSPFPVKHTENMPAQGYRITAAGHTLAYTGDIGSLHSLEELAEQVQGAHLLIIEAGSLTPTPNHLTVEQVLKLQQLSAVPRVLVTHIREQNLPTIREKIGANKHLTIAEDGMTVDIP